MVADAAGSADDIWPLAAVVNFQWCLLKLEPVQIQGWRDIRSRDGRWDVGMLNPKEKPRALWRGNYGFA